MMPGRAAFDRPPLVVFMVAVVLAGLVALAQPFYFTDRSWSDNQLLALEEIEPQRILMITVTPRDVGLYGGAPIDRGVVADVLDRLNAAGAGRVLVDLLFTAPIEAESDARLIEALHDLGPERVAVTNGFQDRLRADPMFTRGLPMVDGRLYADPDRWFRTVGPHPGVTGGANPALWLATGTLDVASLPVDQRLHPMSIERLSVNAFLETDLDDLDVANRWVIVTRSTEIGGARIYIPGYGEADRGVLIAMAAESTLVDQAVRAVRGDQAVTIIGAAALVLGFMAGIFGGPLWRKVTMSVAIALSLYLASVGVVRHFATEAQPHLAILIMLIGLLVALSYRLRLASLIAVFAKGDMSPEEAWAWNMHRDRPDAVLLFGTGGKIKRANSAAPALAKAFGEELTLARVKEIDDGGPARFGDRSYRFEWPVDTLALTVAHDVTEDVQRQEVLHRALVTDALTGVLNRKGFDKALAEAASDRRNSYVVFYLDMNGFKAVNDNHGHAAGDELLQVAANLFSEQMRTEDCIARLGGDEFAILARGRYSSDDLKKLARTIEASLQEPIAVGAARVKIGVAVGFAMPLVFGEPVADVLKRADAAMYARKAQIKRAANEPRAA